MSRTFWHIISRLRFGGHLVCYPAFFNTWNDDHVEKNCFYPPCFARMLEAVGLRQDARLGAPGFGPGRWLRDLGLRVDHMPVLHFVRERSEDAPLREREALRHELYSASRRFSTRAACANLAVLPAVAVLGGLPGGRLPARAAAKAEYMLSMVIDNLTINRCSLQARCVHTGRGGVLDPQVSS